MNLPNLTPELLQKYNSRKNLMLGLSVLFDVIGVLTYFVPILGEGFDLAWAPIAGFIMYIMYGGYLGVFGGMFVFMEELIPFTDFIPGFTIMWFVKYVLFGNRTKQHFIDSKGAHIMPQVPMAKPLHANG